MGCAPVCYHEPGEARTDLGLKNHSQLERYDGCPAVISPHWCLCTCSPDGQQRSGLEPPMAPLHFHPPPPPSPKFGLTKAAATSWQFVPTVKGRSHMFHGWAKSGWVCDRTFLGVFRASLLRCVWTGALLIEFDFMFFNRFKFKLWLQNRCRCNCTNRFFFPPLLQLSSNTQLGTSEQLCLHWSV